MKLRNFIIVLLAVLMVFAFASCKNEPEVKPGPSPSGYTPSDSTVYQLRIDSGVAGREHNSYDKLKLEWDVTSLTAGDTLTLKFRSERDMFQYDIRNGSDKWVYENDKGTFEEPVLGDGGWYTLTYTFGDKNCKGVEWSDNFYPQRHFGVYFRAHYIDNDIFEIMDISLLHEDGSVDELAVTQNNIKSSASLVADFDGKDYEWKREKNYPVFFVQDTDHDVDKVWIAAQKVVAGGTATPYENATSGYTYSFYADKDHTTPFDFSTPINALTYVFYEKVANNNTIKFNLNGGSAKEDEAGAFADQTVATEGVVSMPVAEPVIEGGKLFAAWCTDAAGTQPYDFATKVTESFTLYARYDDPVYVTFDKNDGTTDELRLSRVPLLSGKTVTAPEKPTYGDNYFAGWFLGDAENSFDFDTAITSNITLTAKWYEPVIVTLDPNYKIDDVAVEASSITTGYGIPMDEPKDPAERAGFFFDKWTKDAAGEQEYVFGEEGVAVTEAFTLYAQWIPARTVTLYRNFPDDAEDTVFLTTSIPDGKKFADPDKYPTIAGSYVSKWTTDKTGTGDAYDFDTAVKSDLVLYAQWTNGTLYKLVSTIDSVKSGKPSSNDKFVLVYKGDGQQLASDGDVLSFRFRTTMDLGFVNVRGDAKWVYENSDSAHGFGMTTYETIDGWTYVTFVFDSTKAASGTPPAKDAWWRYDFGSRTIIIGDILEIQGFAFNGKPLAIEAANVVKKSGTNSVGESIEPTYAVVEGGEYAWPSHTVKFEMDVAEEIADKTVAYGKTIAQPDDPVVNGYKFLGWFADDQFATPFDFSAQIFEDTTIYAKFEVKTTTTYTVSFNPNYEGAASKNVEVDEGDSVTAIKVGRPGYFLDGWYTAADNSGEKVDFSTYTATKNDELFAHWTAPTKKYVLTATIDEDVVDDNGTPDNADDDTTYYSDRFQLRWKGDYSGAVKNGDVFTYMVKSIPVEGSSAVTRSRFRDRSGNKSYSSITALSAANDDGWIEMSLTVTQESTKDGILIDFRPASGSLAIGDKLEIMAVALNGKELPISTESSSRGVYEGAKPTISEVSLVQ